MITHQELIDALDYDPVTGVFYWKKCRYKNLVGCQAGDTGKYVRVKLNGKRYAAHVLAWFYIKGTWPKKLVDHKDNNPKNNAFSNLREADHSENSCNRIIAPNKSGVRGVFPKRNGRWLGQIRKNGKIVWRKSFLLLSDAEEAIKQAREELHGEYAKHE